MGSRSRARSATCACARPLASRASRPNGCCCPGSNGHGRRSPARRRPRRTCGRPTTPPKTPSAASPKTRRSGARPRKKRPIPPHPRPALRAAASPPRSDDMATQEIKVPDIGGYDDVPVIEVLVAVGDTIAKDQGLVTLESDKATMEVPSSVAGVVKELKVKVGDTLSEGGVVAVVETQDEAGAADAASDAEKKQAPLPPAGEEGARSAPGEGTAPEAEPAPAGGSGSQEQKPDDRPPRSEEHT